MRSIVFILIIICSFAKVLHQARELKAVARVTGTCTLDGSKSYDPVPGGKIISYNWSKVSGGNCKIVSPEKSITTVTGLIKGVYIFSLKVVSAENRTASATTTVTVVIK